MGGTLVEQRIYSIGKTILCFVIFLICIQPLLLCYLLVSVTRMVWRNILIVKNPQLIFVKKDNLRSFSYTSRNPGTVNICIHLQGEPNVATIRNAIRQTMQRNRPKSDELEFPKLSAELVTCWGFYAWKMCTDRFDINQHIIECPPNYRGRQVTETNVQECISNIITKYLPSTLPPWQICIIPIVPSIAARTDTSTTDAESEATTSTTTATPMSDGNQQPPSECSTFYVVVRMHHLLISEQPNLCLSDLLGIDANVAASSPRDHGNAEVDRQLPTSPLTNIFPYPVYMPQLMTRLQISLTNGWNEFKCKFDPYVGMPKNDWHARKNAQFTGLDRKHPLQAKIPIETLPQLMAALLISYVSIAHDFSRGFYATKHNPKIKLRFLNSLINREVHKRNMSWDVTWQALCTTMSPMRVAKSVFAWIGWLCVAVSILAPHLIYRELQAFRYCFLYGHIGYPGTMIGFLFVYVPMAYRAVNECLQFVAIFITAPRFIYEELIQIHHSDEYVLQNISLCGRKVISWSNKIDVNDIRQVCAKYNISPTELYMSATSAAIREILNDFESVPIPKQIRVFATHHRYDYLLCQLSHDHLESGHLCLTLPMDTVSRQQIAQIHENFRTARNNQIGMYLLFLLHQRFNVLTKFLPAIWTVIIFNYLSRRFSITVTEMVRNGHSFQPNVRLTCWGHAVLDSLYFSPPQSNGSISLSIQQFGDYIRLGVIADAQIHPLHVKLSDGWTRNMEKIKCSMPAG